jgi:hypothetical protein
MYTNVPSVALFRPKSALGSAERSLRSANHVARLWRRSVFNGLKHEQPHDQNKRGMKSNSTQFDH